jgi:glucoamylase
MEQFAFRGRMLPEQIWDSPDVKSAEMYFGKPAGSAMPLMWAHAEYVKLLRSVSDGKVFDLIPVVAERYLKKRGRKNLEVWKRTRQVREVTAGQVLRIKRHTPSGCIGPMTVGFRRATHRQLRLESGLSSPMSPSPAIRVLLSN